MADSASKSSNTENEVALADLKQLESQLVSLNFVLKNTQSEVIKLQKTMARHQTHQDDIDKKLTKLESDLGRFHVNQRADENFRSRFWLYQVITIAVTLLLFIIVHGLLPHSAPPPPVTQTTTTETTESTGTTGTSGNNP